MPQSPIYRIKRMLDNRPFRTSICSMGGVGSTALARHLLSMGDKTHLEHAWSPAVYDRIPRIRLGYMFGNPYNAVLSVFRRNYQDMHSRAMNANSPTSAVSLKGISVEEYLDRGVDEFHIERQFDNWINPANAKHPTVLIKYETLAENIQPVLDFFDCKIPFHLRGRNSRWTDQPEPIRRGLERMYQGLMEKIEVLPPVVILHGNGAQHERERAPHLVVAQG